MDTIELTSAEMTEGLRLMREMEHAHAVMHVAEQDYQRYIGHLAAIHHVPAGFGLRDWTVGFEPIKEESGG